MSLSISATLITYIQTFIIIFVFVVGAQQYHVFIAEAMQCTHNALELNNTLRIILNHLLEERRERHEMQYTRLPETRCQRLANFYGQWL